jgi:hypothetical protein
MDMYLETHKRTIVTFLDQLNSKLMDVSEIEAKLPKSFLQLHEVISNILKENDIIEK